jgi:hypothetical protein
MGRDCVDFTTNRARAVLRRPRMTEPSNDGTAVGPRGGAEAALLAPFRGRWVAQDGLEILFDADQPEAVLHWLRGHGRSARVWRVPVSALETGSALSSP